MGAMMIKKLNLGCGEKIKEGYINVDRIAFLGVDKVVDLNKIPYPFKANTFELIEMDSVLEHLDDVPKVMEELYRICKNNAIIKIIVPHFASLSVHIDPTHKRGMSYGYFNYFDKEQKQCSDYRFKCNFKTIKKQIVFPKYLRWFSLIANQFPGVYESNFCYIIRPWRLEIELRAIK